MGCINKTKWKWKLHTRQKPYRAQHLPRFHTGHWWYNHNVSGSCFPSASCLLSVFHDKCISPCAHSHLCWKALVCSTHSHKPHQFVNSCTTESFRRGMKQKKPTLTKSGSTKATQPIETVWEESILLMYSMRLHSTSSYSKSLPHSSYIKVISCS